MEKPQEKAALPSSIPEDPSPANPPSQDKRGLRGVTTRYLYAIINPFVPLILRGILSESPIAPELGA